MVQNRESNEAREPEKHSQSVQSGNDMNVGEAGEEARGEAQVDEHENGPDRGEDHEIDL